MVSITACSSRFMRAVSASASSVGKWDQAGETSATYPVGVMREYTPTTLARPSRANRDSDGMVAAVTP